MLSFGQNDLYAADVSSASSVFPSFASLFSTTPTPSLSWRGTATCSLLEENYIARYLRRVVELSEKRTLQQKSQLGVSPPLEEGLGVVEVQVRAGRPRSQFSFFVLRFRLSFFVLRSSSFVPTGGKGGFTSSSHL